MCRFLFLFLFLFSSCSSLKYPDEEIIHKVLKKYDYSIQQNFHMVFVINMTGCDPCDSPAIYKLSTISQSEKYAKYKKVIILKNFKEKDFLVETNLKDYEIIEIRSDYEIQSLGLLYIENVCLVYEHNKLIFWSTF